MEAWFCEAGYMFFLNGWDLVDFFKKVVKVSQVSAVAINGRRLTASDLKFQISTNALRQFSFRLFHSFFQESSWLFCITWLSRLSTYAHKPEWFRCHCDP